MSCWNWLPWNFSSKSASVNDSNVTSLNKKELSFMLRDRTIVIDSKEEFYDKYVRYMTTQILRDIRSEMELDDYGGNYANVKYDSSGAAWFEIHVSHILTKELKLSLREAMGKHGWSIEIIDEASPTNETGESIVTRIKIYLTHGELVR